MAVNTWCRSKIGSGLLKCTVSFSYVWRWQTRQRSRGLRRKIVRVLTPEEEKGKLTKLNKHSKLNVPHFQRNLENLGDYSDPADEHVRNQGKTIATVGKDGNRKNTTAGGDKLSASNMGSFQFERLRDSEDSRFGPLVMDTKSQKQREKKRVILLEGTRLIKDAIEAGAVLRTLFFSRMEAVEGLPLKNLSVPIYKVQHHYLKLWSDMVTPAGVMGIFQMPNKGEITVDRPDKLPLTLVCDNVRDPGNMGTIIRVAAAVGCERILASKGCVDIWEPKVLRSGAGCHFRVPIINQLEWDALIGYFPPSSQVCLADVGHMKDDTPRKFTRRMSEESFNEILDSSLASNRIKIDPSEVENDAEDSSSSQKSDFEDKRLIKLYNRLSLPAKVYYQVDFNGPHIVLVISNESTGPSAQAKKAVFDNYGQIVMVPMAANVESLNNSIAAGIILFEIRKQLMLGNLTQTES